MGIPLRILMIEDSEDDVLLAIRSLKKEGYQPSYERVDDAEAMRKALEREPWDVILCDYNMPKFTAIDAIALLKEVGVDIPLIIVSGVIGEKVAAECMRLGANDFFMKENLARLASAVKRELKEAESRAKRRETEKALRVSEDKFKYFFEHSPIGKSIVFFSGKIEVNKAFTKMLGYSRDEFKKDRWQDITHPEDVELSQRVIDSLISGEKNNEKFAKRYLHKNGSIVWADVVITLRRDQEGSPLYLMTSIIDITERKKNEMEREKLQSQLVQAQKMEAVGVLAGGIAHDFNNLLTVILGNSNLLLADNNKNDDDKNMITEIQLAGQRGADLVRQLLGFSRKQVIQPQILNLNILLKNTEKILNRLISENIELKMIQAPKLWKIKIDPGQLDQIIINLSVNAKDTMPMGGRITFETANVELGVNFFKDRGIEPSPGPYVMLAVSDTGHGIDKKILKHIFEPFFTTKEMGKGTGLGLSTVYGIVKQNKGFIRVNSEPGQGAVFKIYLPKEMGEEKTKENEKTSKPELTGHETVLIVEDDESLRKYAQKILQSFGYAVLIAEDGEVALTVGEEWNGMIHLMITDVIMPKMNCKDLSDKMQLLYPDIKILYMSGYTDKTIVSQGMLEPGINFLQKPFTQEEFRRKIREVLGSNLS